MENSVTKTGKKEGSSSIETLTQHYKEARTSEDLIHRFLFLSLFSALSRARVLSDLSTVVAQDKDKEGS